MTEQTTALIERLEHLRLFLNGEAPLGDLWFGDTVERIGERPANFWWRAHLSCLSEAATLLTDNFAAERRAMFDEAVFDPRAWGTVASVQLIEQPEPSDWQCLLTPDGRTVFRPSKGGEPNRFHRFMQRLAFGIVWERVP